MTELSLNLTVKRVELGEPIHPLCACVTASDAGWEIVFETIDLQDAPKVGDRIGCTLRWGES